MANTGKLKQNLVLVIGAGPAGLFAANKLAEAGNKVVIINRDIKYGGLAEYGIFLSKHKMKEGLRKQFRKVLSNPDIKYYGNVTIGKNAKLSFEELRNIGFDAVVVSAGAQGTKKVGIPGEDAKGILHAKDVVYHYNSLPPFSEKEIPLGDRVAIIGIGNVMADIAHWLIHYKKVKEVIAIARRGPNERAYEDKEMKAIAFNMDKDLVKQEMERIRTRLEAIDQDVDKTYEELIKDCDKPYTKTSPGKLYFRFLSSPKSVIVGENNEVKGLVVEENILEMRNGKVAPKGTGETSTIELDNVIFAIGDRVDENLGLPVDKWGEFVKNESPYENDSEAHLFEIIDETTKKVVKGTFVVGWSRKASDGLVGIAKKDGETGTKYVLKYLDEIQGAETNSILEYLHENRGSDLSADERIQKLDELLKAKEIFCVDKNDIENLEAVEKAEAEKKELEFFKFSSNDDMLKVISQARKATV